MLAGSLREIGAQSGNGVSRFDVAGYEGTDVYSFTHVRRSWCSERTRAWVGTAGIAIAFVATWIVGDSRPSPNASLRSSWICDFALGDVKHLRACRISASVCVGILL